MRLTDKDTDDKKQRDKKIRSIFLRCIFFAFVIWMVFHKHFKEIFENTISMKAGSLVLILILGASYQIINAAAFYLLVKKNNRDFTMRQSLESLEGSLVSSTLVMYRLATYFFPFLISIVVFGKVDRQRIKTA